MKRGLKAHVLDLFADDLTRTKMAQQASPAASPLPPPQPVAKRLNRNALTVAAVIMGMTVIACLVVLRDDPRPTATTHAAADPTLSDVTAPSFLDRPVRIDRGPAPIGTGSATAPKPSVAAPAWPPSAPIASTAPTQYPQQVGFPTSSDAAAISSPASGVAAQPREQAFDAALRRSAVARLEGGSASAEGGASPATSNNLAAEEAHLVAYGDSLMRGAAQNMTGAGPASPTASSASPRRAFMQQAGDLGGRSVIARLEPAETPFALRAGTVIPAILLTAITSDLPGDCMGQVSRDVYDSKTERILLIPKGSKLMCRYDDQVVAGQGRLLVAWTRLMLPDGRSMTLPGLALKDAQGQTGAKGDVDNHTRRVFGRALLLSAIGAGVQLSQPRQASVLATPTTGQVMAGAVGQEMSNVALEVLRRGIDQPPTITVPQGQTFNVFLNGDLVFDGPYAQSP